MSDPVYDFHLTYQPPVAPRVDANKTVQTALALVAYGDIAPPDIREACLELLNRNDWTVYFP